MKRRSNTDKRKGRNSARWVTQSVHRGAARGFRVLRQLPVALRPVPRHGIDPCFIRVPSVAKHLRNRLVISSRCDRRPGSDFAPEGQRSIARGARPRSCAQVITLGAKCTYDEIWGGRRLVYTRCTPASAPKHEFISTPPLSRNAGENWKSNNCNTCICTLQDQYSSPDVAKTLVAIGLTTCVQQRGRSPLGLRIHDRDSAPEGGRSTPPGRHASIILLPTLSSDLQR
jgi:hypothetical protein